MRAPIADGTAARILAEEATLPVIPEIPEGLTLFALDDMHAGKINWLFNQVREEKGLPARDFSEYLWAFWKSPAGVPVGSVILNEEGDAVASFALLPRQVWVAGSMQLIYEAGENVVHKDYRGGSLTRAVGAHCLQQLSNRGGVMAFGQCKHSRVCAAGRRWFGYQELFQMVAREKQLNLLPSDDVAAGNLTISEEKTYGKVFNQIWHHVRDQYSVLMARTARQLDWRYGKSSPGQHTAYVARDADKAVGYVIVKYRKDDGNSIATIVDLMCGKDEKVAASLLQHAEQQAAIKGYAKIRFSPTTNTLAAKVMKGYSPTTLGASKPMIAVPLWSRMADASSKSVQTDLLDASKWHFAAGDFVLEN